MASSRSPLGCAVPAIGVASKALIFPLPSPVLHCPLDHAAGARAAVFAQCDVDHLPDGLCSRYAHQP
jgi:hypothetical protein